MIIHSRQFT